MESVNYTPIPPPLLPSTTHTTSPVPLSPLPFLSKTTVHRPPFSSTSLSSTLASHSRHPPRRTAPFHHSVVKRQCAQGELLRARHVDSAASSQWAWNPLFHPSLLFFSFCVFSQMIPPNFLPYASCHQFFSFLLPFFKYYVLPVSFFLLTFSLLFSSLVLLYLLQACLSL